MPSAYAHERMGQEVRKKLRGEPRRIVDTCPELFEIGLQGPDIFFYYKPLFDNQVNRIGNELHARSGMDFAQKAADIVKKHRKEIAYTAYLYGFLCHFALDVTCHGYIGQKIAESGISHAEIEVEFDRMLMLKDGCDPIRHRLTEHIVPSPENAAVIQAFYEKADEKQVRSALKGMITYDKLLLAPSRFKRFILHTALKLTGNYKEMHGHIVNYQANPLCEDSTRRLWELYQDAAKLAYLLIDEWQDCMEGIKSFHSIYSYNFNSDFVEEKESKDAH